MNPGEVHVWRVDLDTDHILPPPLPDDADRAARFVNPDHARRYLQSHGALRAILIRLLGHEPRIATGTRGKPYLPDAPQWCFNLSHSRGLALVAIARDVEIGVDVEYVRPHRERDDIVERFFPPSLANEYLMSPETDRDTRFFRYWTRLEAMWKALGVGLYGAGQEMDGPWTIEDLHLGAGVAAAVAAHAPGLRVLLHAFGE